MKYQPNCWMYEGDNDAHVLAWRQSEDRKASHELMRGLQGGTLSAHRQLMAQYGLSLSEGREYIAMQNALNVQEYGRNSWVNDLFAGAVNALGGFRR